MARMEEVITMVIHEADELGMLARSLGTVEGSLLSTPELRRVWALD